MSLTGEDEGHTGERDAKPDEHRRRSWVGPLDKAVGRSGPDWACVCSEANPMMRVASGLGRAKVAGLPATWSVGTRERDCSSDWGPMRRQQRNLEEHRRLVPRRLLGRPARWWEDQSRRDGAAMSRSAVRSGGGVMYVIAGGGCVLWGGHRKRGVGNNAGIEGERGSGAISCSETRSSRAASPDASLVSASWAPVGK